MEENFEAVEERKEFEEVMTEKAKDRTPLMVTAAAVVVGSAVMYMGYLVGARCHDGIKNSRTKFINWVKGKSEPKEKSE